MNLLATQHYAYNGVSINVRRGAYHHFDTGIFREVAGEYFWEGLPVTVETAIDVGGHIGSWTRRLSYFYPTVTVAAVEVDRENAMMLRLNTYDLPGARVFEGAMTYETGDLYLHHTDDGNSGGHRVESEGDEVIEKTYTLEDVMDAMGFDRVDVLKLDCEGSEFSILNNCKVSTLKKIGCIVGEYHSTRDVFIERVGKRLEKYGFKLRYQSRVDEMGMFLAVRG